MDGLADMKAVMPLSSGISNWCVKDEVWFSWYQEDGIVNSHTKFFYELPLGMKGSQGSLGKWLLNDAQRYCQ